MDCSLPGSSVHGIFQARILEWVAISFSRGSSWPRDWTQVSHITGSCFTVWVTRETQFKAIAYPDEHVLLCAGYHTKHFTCPIIFLIQCLWGRWHQWISFTYGEIETQQRSSLSQCHLIEPSFESEAVWSQSLFIYLLRNENVFNSWGLIVE